MAAIEQESVLREIRDSIEVQVCHPPADETLIAATERELGVELPPWLKSIYQCCDGFRGPTGVRYLYPLAGLEGVQGVTSRMRNEEWSPRWLKNAIVFGDNGIGGTLAVHWLALNGDLVEWCLGDGEVYSILDGDLFDLWRREQQLWNEVR